MEIFSDELELCKTDIEISVKIWKEIFNTKLSSRITAAYFKGSALKEIATFVDYVPIISDIDFHVYTKEEYLMGNTLDDLDTSLDIISGYESRFTEIHPNYFHIPRSSVHTMADLAKVVPFLSPLPEDVEVIFGGIPLTLFKQEDPDQFHKVDLNNIDETKKVFDMLAMDVYDRSTMDNWHLLRKLTWRISPSASRVLSLTSENPQAVWSMNRTTVLQHLDKAGHQDLTVLVKSYYESAWTLFQSDFKDYSQYRKMFRLAFRIVNCCFDKAKEINLSDTF